MARFALMAAIPAVSATFGKDTYAMSHPFAFKDFMETYLPTAENKVQQNQTSTCVEWVKLCIDDGHMTACSGPQGNFQMHAVGAYKRDAGQKSMEQLETEYTLAMGDMTSYDPYFENHMAVLTADIDHYVNAFDSGNVPYYASTFTDPATKTQYKSVLVQIPGSLAPSAKSLISIMLLGSSSTLLAGAKAVAPLATSSALAAAHEHLSTAPRKLSADGKPVIAKVHRSFASSDLSRDVTYFENVLQGEKEYQDGSVYGGKMVSSDAVFFRYVQTSTATQGPVSVAAWEEYQVSLHNQCFDSTNNQGFDRLADNHFGHAMGQVKLDAFIKAQKAAGYPYRFYGGGQQHFFYLYAPNGWGCQVIGKCTSASLCPTLSDGGYDMCTQGIKGHCNVDGVSHVAV